MPVTLHHCTLSTGYSGPLMFYRPKNGGKLIPCYDDSQTRDALIGSKDSGALYTLLRSLYPNNRGSKLYLPGTDGKPHHVALYVDGDGRTKINTFNQPELPCFVGANQDYSPDVLGISLYLKGLPQVEDAVLGELGYPNGQWFSDYFQDPLHGSERQANQLYKGGYTIKRHTDIKQANRSETQEETENRKRMVAAQNKEVIDSCIKTGKILVPFEKDDQIMIPKLIAECLEGRGIDRMKLSPATLMHLGFCKGMKPYSTDGTLYKTSIKGFMVRLGENSWQMRLCTQNWDGSISFKSKKDGLRFVTLGPAMPFLLKEAISSSLNNDKRPIVLSEGMFDALSMEAASNGWVSAASTQGCQNYRYISEQASILAKNQIPVIVAFDPDASGQTNAQNLINLLHDEGVHVYGWPGALLKGGDMNDLLKNSPSAAENLVRFMGALVQMSEKGTLTPEKTNAITGMKTAHEGMTPEECVQNAFDTVRECFTTSDIEGLANRAEQTYRKTESERLCYHNTGTTISKQNAVLR